MPKSDPIYLLDITCVSHDERDIPPVHDEDACHSFALNGARGPAAPILLYGRPNERASVCVRVSGFRIGLRFRPSAAPPP